MRVICYVLMITLLTAMPSLAEDYRDLFNGKDLTGWVIEGARTWRDGDKVRTIWSVADGMIVADAGKNGFGFLRYEPEQFSDFVFRAEYRFAPRSPTQPGGNSGLGIRTVPFDPTKSALTRPSYASYEIQLLDDAGKPAGKHCSASLYRYAGPSANHVKPAPEWNTIEVVCQGPRITITMNGEKVLDADQTEIADLPGTAKPKGAPAPWDKPLKGYLCLQSHTGKVEFRKVQVRSLNSKPSK